MVCFLEERENPPAQAHLWMEAEDTGLWSHTDLSLNDPNPIPLLGALWPIAKFDLRLLGPSLHQTLSGNPAFHFVPGTILCPVTRMAHKNMPSPPWETHGPGRRLTEAVIITIISISKRGWYRGEAHPYGI